MSRYKPKKQTRVKLNKLSPKKNVEPYRDTIWERSPLTRVVGLRIANEVECFQCLNCDYEFRAWPISKTMARLLAFPCRDPDCYYCQCGVCKSGGCPICGSVYVEWLSFDTSTEDIYFTSEWESGTRTYYGTAREV